MCGHIHAPAPYPKRKETVGQEAGWAPSAGLDMVEKWEIRAGNRTTIIPASTD